MSALYDEALGLLVALAAEEAEPPAAEDRLAGMRARFPELRFRLVWQREEYDRTHHYDLLVKGDRPGTVSLSYCPDKALPWPLRGTHRADDRLLLRVNGVDMELDQAIGCLDVLWNETRLADRLVTACLVQEVLAEEPVEFGPGDRQRALEAFRRARGLLTAEATREWMRRHGLGERALEDLVAQEATVAAVRERVTAGRVEAYFVEHRRGLDLVRTVRVAFADPGEAKAAAEELRAGADFYAVAERARTATATMTTVRRDELPETFAEAGPGHTAEAGPHLIRVVSEWAAVLDDGTRRLIAERLFDAWLADRRRDARVQWFWGDAS
ncbi:TIGR04500 family putative peptide maturation system protein [Actinocorallia aurantiaca]|uniref:TIGR04500 family peptide maturation system protein n=1 Tax=Actinocorallia aurantiaca TaxID=46204 RepID=A0ABN3TZX2_9ACTN